jgi:hypothetical protein
MELKKIVGAEDITLETLSFCKNKLKSELVKEAEEFAEELTRNLVFANYENRLMAKDMFVNGYVSSFIEKIKKD